MTAMLGQSSGSFWLPDTASSYATDVDWIFKFVYWVCVIMFVLIVGLMVLFVWRYRKRPGRHADKSHTQSTTLELTWTIIPTIIVVVIFYFGLKAFLDMTTPPPNAYEINVTAYKWAWAFTYPNGYVDQDLHVPKDRPIRLILSSQDVIHSLFIPNFRIKRDAVPGRYNKMWFQATEEGEFPLFCAEYCGTKHSEMVAKVVVHDATKFASWLEKASAWVEKMPPVDAGKKLYTARGCSQCHSVDGTAVIGPSFKNIFGEEQMLTDGSKVEIDENYIRNSILNPAGQVAAGYENVMPTYQGRLKDVEITALIEYIKSLSDDYEPPTAVDEGTAAAGSETENNETTPNENVNENTEEQK
jgi:cytochrome c oxidase subunit 2